MMRAVVALLTLLPLVFAETSTPNTGDQENAFRFSFNPDNFPALDSCPTPIPLQPAVATLGNLDGISSYALTFLVNEQMMTSNGTIATDIYAHTISFNSLGQTQYIPNPLMNRTQFIACIWGSGGKSGGCQDLQSIVPSANWDDAYANNSSVCRSPPVYGSWATPYNKRLAVDVAGLNGVVNAQSLWQPSCSDLQFTPKNGTPPYTLVISPAFKPPVNITGNSTAPLNYTIRLTHGQAFFASMFDSAGSSWALGPFHSGITTNTSCLAVLTGQSFAGGPMASSGGSSGVSVAALGGGIAGAFVVGALLAGLVVWFLAKKRKNVGRGGSSESLDGYDNPRPATWRSNTHASIAKVDNNVSPYTDLNSPMSDGGHSLSYNHNLERAASPQSPTHHQLHAGSLNSLNNNINGQEQAYRNLMGLGDFHPQMQQGSSQGAQSDSGMGMAGPSGSSYNLAGGSMSSQAGPSSPRKSVYVVHSDGGQNVHIQLPEGGADVVELPPNYNPGIHGGTGNSPVNEKSGRH